MGFWQDRVIVVGVTGSIAAYKTCELVSFLVKEGARVHVVMTRAATHLVGPLTFQELTRQPVRVEMFGEGQWEPVIHVSLAQSAQLLVIVPATADIIGKVASGIADDLLSTTIMASSAPVVFAPAMNDVMWANAVVQANVARLSALGYRFVEPEEGALLCGTRGRGRLASLERILEVMAESLRGEESLAGRRVLVTAGPTREAIDPVRFLSNRSSGRMGYAIAREAARRGAEVVLVSGPTAVVPPSGVEIIRVESVAEMAEAVLSRAAAADVIIKAAAPADFTLAKAVGHKIKKTEAALHLELIPSTDILAELGRRKRPGQLLVGFAAETDDLLSNARATLRRKNLDLIVANDVTQPGAGFDVDTNVVTVADANGSAESWPALPKEEVARRLLNKVATLLQG